MGTDDIVLQIETDKVTVDVRYTTGKPGKLKEMLVKEEDTVAVGQEVAIVTEGEEGSAAEGDKVSSSACVNSIIFVHSLHSEHMLDRLSRPSLVRIRAINCVQPVWSCAVLNLY